MIPEQGHGISEQRLMETHNPGHMSLFNTEVKITFLQGFKLEIVMPRDDWY